MRQTGEALLVPDGNGRSKVSPISPETKRADRREGGGRARSSDDEEDNITSSEQRGSAVLESFDKMRGREA